MVACPLYFFVHAWHGLGLQPAVLVSMVRSKHGTPRGALLFSMVSFHWGIIRTSTRRSALRGRAASRVIKQECNVRLITFPLEIRKATCVMTHRFAFCSHNR